MCTYFKGQLLIPCPSASQFRCGADGNGPCLETSRRCDGVPDCPDSSDELYCVFRMSPTLFYYLFFLRSLYPFSCMETNLFITNYHTFPPFVFAKMKKITECRKNEYRCSDGSCIDIRRKCDGYPDCRDRGDELNCSEYHILHCRSTFCLSFSLSLFIFACFFPHPAGSTPTPLHHPVGG